MSDVSGKMSIALAHINSLISAGRPGTRLPGEKELAQQIGVSRVTVREALDLLWSEGAVVRRWGAGTFIAQRTNAEDITSFNNYYVATRPIGSLPKQISDAGLVAELSHFRISGDRPDWMAIHFPEVAAIWRVERCFSINGTPGIFLSDVFPKVVGSTETSPADLANIDNDFPSFLRSAGIRVVKHEATVLAEAVSDYVGGILGMAPSSPVLAERQRAISDAGDVVACSDIVYRTDVFGQILIRTVAE
jgi:GntR family transcriptional regulator